MSAPARHFDPLEALEGLWTTDLAERYLPIPGVPPAKYECLDGHLIMSPCEGAWNSYGELALGAILRERAPQAGFRAYSRVNLRFGEQRWIEPDLTVLRGTSGQLWVPAEQVVMPVEFVSPGSRWNDEYAKPRLCAEAKIPYFLRVKIEPYSSAFVELLRLDEDRYLPHATAWNSERFETELPFPFSFDPEVLIES